MYMYIYIYIYIFYYIIYYILHRAYVVEVAPDVLHRRPLAQLPKQTKHKYTHTYNI